MLVLDLLEVKFLIYKMLNCIDNADLVKEGMVYSFRNGRSEVVDEHIRLEVDKFGKVQEEPEVR